MIHQLKLLLAGSDDGDVQSVRSALDALCSPGDPYLRWRILRRTSSQSAVATLKQHRIGIVLWEDDRSTGSWRGALCGLAASQDPPLFILISRLADECLWAEALNLGVWDVLAKPLDRQELSRVLRSADLHWRARYASTPSAGRALAATAIAFEEKKEGHFYV